jgi:hypothetical protein
LPPISACRKARLQISRRANASCPDERCRMSKSELVIQLIKVALGLGIGGYFIWWSVEVLHRLPAHAP